MTDEILARIDALAEKLGTTADYLWGVLVQQAAVAVWIQAFQVFVCIVAVAIFVAVAIWFKRLAEAASGGEKEERHVFASVSLLLAFCILVGAMMESIDILTPLLNPEYWALQKIMEGFR